MSNVYLERLATVAITGKSTGEVWDYDIAGDYLYIAGSDDGIYVFNISDPALPVYETTVTFDESSGVTFSGECTDVLVIGSNLYACGRSVNFTGSNDAGCVAKYDISGANAASPSWTAAYNPSSMSPRPSVNSGYGNDWYQGMATDGTYLYLASQFNGLTVVNPSTMTLHGAFDYDDLLTDANFALYSGTDNSGGSGNSFLTDTTQSWTVDDLIGKQVVNLTTRIRYRIDDNTATALTSLTALQKGTNVDWGFSNGQSYVIVEDPYFSWETSRCTYGEDSSGNGWVFMATHGNGVIAISVGGTESPAAPGNPQWYDMYVASPLAGSGFTTNAQMRVRNVLYDNYVLYAAPNCNDNAESGNRPERGLLCIDVSDPTAVNSSDWVLTSIGINDNDSEWPATEVTAQEGDRPIMGLTKLGDKVFMANGQRGTAVFDVSSPLAPVYQSLQGKGMEAGTNLYQSFAFDKDGGQYCYYSHSFGSLDTNLLYVDRIHLEGIKMFTIGLHGSTASTDQVSCSPTRALSCDMSRTYTAVAGDVVTDYTVRVQDSAAARTFEIALYSVVLGVPYKIVTGSEAQVENTNTTGTEWRTLTITGLNIGLTAGVEYCVCVIQASLTSTSKIARAGVTNNASLDTSVTGGDFNSDWTEASNVQDMCISAVGRNYSGGSGGTITSTII